MPLLVILCESSSFLLFQVLSKEEGGRATPFMSNYRPQLFIRTADVTVGLTFPEGTEHPDEKMAREIFPALINDFGLLTYSLGYAR